VETFYDALSALRRAKEYLPDILISDIDMPEMNGVALAEAVQERNPKCKIILISGDLNWKARRDLRGYGVDGFVFLPKPFSRIELLRLIKSE
jgi:YesN/AraC family two-component response regulator